MGNSTKKPVVVYGASGYTGRLVCEYLREYNIPFIAAGRSKEKLDDAMRSHDGSQVAAPGRARRGGGAQAGGVGWPLVLGRLA